MKKSLLDYTYQFPSDLFLTQQKVESIQILIKHEPVDSELCESTYSQCHNQLIKFFMLGLLDLSETQKQHSLWLCTWRKQKQIMNSGAKVTFAFVLLGLSMLYNIYSSILNNIHIIRLQMRDAFYLYCTLIYASNQEILKGSSWTAHSIQFSI